jgi:hypothetical protein
MAGRISYYGNIVKDGLVLDLDAAKRDSYPGTGMAWNDISGFRNNGTLVNGPTFNSGNGGSVVFDGVDDYINNIGSLNTFSFIQNTGIFSINFWFKITTLNTRNVILGNGLASSDKGFFIAFEYIASYGFNALRIASFRGVSGTQIFVGTTNDNIITDINWHNGCYTNNNTLTGQWYVDGIPVTTTSRYNPADINAPDGIKSTGDSTRTLNVGRANYTSTAVPLKGNLAQTLIYNRALSATEVLQNYNATKGRYL